MFQHLLRNPRIRYLTTVTAIALLIALLTATAVYAALYNISTSDNSVADWGGISVYQTDPAGDVPGVDPKDDAINTWVAAGPVGSSMADRELYFRLQVNGSPALLNNHSAVAQISCDDPNSFETVDDRAVYYVPWCTGANAERVGVMQGDQSGINVGIGPSSGQRVGDQLEWGAKLSDIEQGDAGWNNIDCSGTIWIRFMTADASGYCVAPGTGTAFPIDRVDGRENVGIGVPTVIEIQQVEVSKQEPSLLWPLIAGLAAGFGVFVVAFRRRNRNTEV